MSSTQMNFNNTKGEGDYSELNMQQSPHSTTANERIGYVIMYLFAACFIVSTLQGIFKTAYEFIYGSNESDQRNTRNITIEKKNRSRKDINEYIVSKKAVSCFKDKKKSVNKNQEYIEIGTDVSLCAVSVAPTFHEEDQDDIYGSKTCAICIEPIEVDDEVSWSRYQTCEHVFHHECISFWLKNHEDCPYCRRTYFLELDTEEKDQCQKCDDLNFCVLHGLVPESHCTKIECEKETSVTSKDSSMVYSKLQVTEDECQNE